MIIHNELNTHLGLMCLAYNYKTTFLLLNICSKNSSLCESTSDNDNSKPQAKQRSPPPPKRRRKYQQTNPNDYGHTHGIPAEIPVITFYTSLNIIT